jgi:hypothetical protein
LNKSVVAPHGKSATITSIPLWYKASKNNLYSVYNVGQLDVTVMTRYSFTQEHLDEIDFERLQAHLGDIVNVDDDDREEDNDEDNDGQDEHDVTDTNQKPDQE